MFTGLVEGMGEIVGVSDRAGTREIRIRPPFPPEELRAGDSISVHGVCLTLTGDAGRDRTFCVQAVAETQRRSTLGGLRAGDRVHLERALRAGDRMGGHLVQGHVDGLGQVRRSSREGGSWVLEISVPPELARYIVEKGSICVDGVSLTVVRRTRDLFRVDIVPHTAEATLLASYAPGRRVNLEVDVVAKYVESLLRADGRLPSGPEEE
jgi:riboflavin synthase